MPEPPTQAVVLDAGVASRSFRERFPPRLGARLVGQQPIFTFVTVGELTQWTKLRHWGPRNLAMSGSWLAGKPVIPVNETWVAACCLACQLPLATLHLKDFRDFAGHHGLRLLEP